MRSDLPEASRGGWPFDPSTRPVQRPGRKRDWPDWVPDFSPFPKPPPPPPPPSPQPVHAPKE